MESARIPTSHNYEICAALLLCVVAYGMLPAQQQYRIVGYYPMWARTTLPAASVNFDILTHVNHAFAWPNSDGSIAPGEQTVDTALINTTHRAGRKILLSLGGAGAIQTANFALVVGDTSLRRVFITNIVSHLSAFHYDGADLDWEGPASRSDKINEVAFVQQLYSAFQTVNSEWLLTMAIGPSNWSGQWRDYSALLPYVNWFNVMEYDFHGSWSSVSGHNAPLYVGSDPLSDPDAYSIELSVQYLLVTRAIPKSKLTLGLPFYGKMFGTSALYTSYSGEQDLAYRDIVASVQSGTWTYHWDAASGAPYFASNSPAKLITFDDSTSIAMKCHFVKDLGLSGLMVWEITQDVIGQRQPLLDVIGAHMTTTFVVFDPAWSRRPTGFALSDNYPNPFNPATRIQYSVPTTSRVVLNVYDILGRVVGTLVNEVKPAGSSTATFDASRFRIPSGVYFYKIQAGPYVETKRMVLVR